MAKPQLPDLQNGHNAVYPQCGLGEPRRDVVQTMEGLNKRELWFLPAEHLVLITGRNMCPQKYETPESHYDSAWNIGDNNY